MNNFEKQLSASSKRVAAKQISGIAPVAKPSVHRHVAVAWYTTPAAAVAGLLVGLFLQFGSPRRGGTAPTVTVVHDTIVEHVYDTIRVKAVPPMLLTKAEPATLPKHSSVAHSRHSSVALTTTKKPTGGGSLVSTGRCMAEDGIDYSKLVSCAY